MPYSTDAKRRARPRARPLCVAALAGMALAAAGCAGSAGPGVARLPSATRASSASPKGGGSSPESPGTLQQQLVAFAKCMRSNGVPKFPDPSPSGGFVVGASSGIDPGSPAAKAAQAKCRHFMPPGPGSGPPPSPQTLARFLSIARCMRQHGVYDFPDPRTKAPPNPLGSGASVISDIEGVILVFPSTFDEQSPAFMRAAARCAFPLHNH